MALLVEVSTDNRNRTASDIRSIVTKSGGSIATPGSVSRLFHRKGQIIVSREAAGEDQLMELALDAGAEDFKSEPQGYEILTEPADFEAVHKQIEARNIKYEAAEITSLPTVTVPLNDSAAIAAIDAAKEAILKAIDHAKENASAGIEEGKKSTEKGLDKAKESTKLLDPRPSPGRGRRRASTRRPRRRVAGRDRAVIAPGSAVAVRATRVEIVDERARDAPAAGDNPERDHEQRGRRPSEGERGTGLLTVGHAGKPLSRNER